MNKKIKKTLVTIFQNIEIKELGYLKKSRLGLNGTYVASFNRTEKGFSGGLFTFDLSPGHVLLNCTMQTPFCQDAPVADQSPSRM